jgi:hypothetical protein
MMGWKSVQGILLSAICLTGVIGVPEPLTISLLKDTRSELTVIPYTPEERVFVAQQAQNLFSVRSLL